MKHIFLITTLLLTLGTANAQSDASWEETIEWINSKLKRDGDFNPGEQYRSILRIDNYGFATYEISGKDSSEYQYKYSFGLTNLESVAKCTNDNCIVLMFTSKVVKKKENHLRKSTKRTIDSVKIYLIDESASERMSNAFSHLITMVSREIKFDEKF